MALLAENTLIHIGGKLVPTFKHLYLNQQIAAHHTLEVVFQMETFEKDSTELGEKSKEFLGKTISVQITSISRRSEYGTLEFKGVITEVHIAKSANSSIGAEITILAKSTPFLTDDGPHYNSYNEKRLADVVGQVLDANKIDHEIAPRYTELIDYCVQHNESNYAFIKRLAAQYGEWFYYNGEKVIFGKPEAKETKLKDNGDLASFSVSLAPQSHNHNFYTNDYLNDKVEENDNHTKPSGASAFNGFVYDRSNELYKNKTTLWNNNNNSPIAKKQLTSKVKAQQESIVINHVRFSGSSKNPGVKLGNIVIIKGEKYRIVGVAHSANSNGQYENHFEAISGSFEAYPKTNINAFPKSTSQTAKVMENYDPEGLARVKVQFAWQVAENKKTSWVRIVSPSASKGQGFFFIPEVGDEVYVDFEGGNAECPYVVGSLFNANAGPPSGSSNSSNHIKMLQSRSGSIVKLNDEDGSVTISDKAGSSITMDGVGNITIHADEKIDIDAKEINMVAKDKAKVDAKQTLELSSGDKATLNAKNTIFLGADEKTATTVNIKGKSKINLKAPQIVGEAKSSVALKGATVDINGTTMTNVKGGTVNLN